MNGTIVETAEKNLPKDLATIRIDRGLYALLSAKARGEGRVLKRMVEDHLRLLVEIQPLASQVEGAR